MNHLENFKVQAIVIDTETTNCIPKDAEIVELAGTRFDQWTDKWVSKSKLYGAKNGIPFEASAKNNISNRMIAGLPTFVSDVRDAEDILDLKKADDHYYIAHNSVYDQTVLATAFNAAWCLEYEKIATDRSRWICTMRLAKHLLSDMDGIQFNLGYLRYMLDLNIPEDCKNHRAADDTIVAVELLQSLIEYAIAMGRIDENQDIGYQLNKLCWSPIISKTFPFGKHKGKLLSEIPTDYWLWALDNMDSLNPKSDSFDSDLLESIRIELERRV